MARLQPRSKTPGKRNPKAKPAPRSYRNAVTARQKRKQSAEGPSLEGLIGVAITGPVGYLAVEGIMNDNRHPIHWLVTVVVGVLGYGIGQGVYRWKETH